MNDKVKAHMALVEEYAGYYARATTENLYGTSKSYTKQCFEAANESRAAVEAALRDAPQAEPTERNRLIERYAQAAHWYINAHDNELQEQGDTREAAIKRVHAIDGELLASGYEWLAARPSAPAAVEPDERAMFEAWYFDKYMLHANRHLLDPDRYAYPHTQDTWIGWQARASKGKPT